MKLSSFLLLLLLVFLCSSLSLAKEKDEQKLFYIFFVSSFVNKWNTYVPKIQFTSAFCMLKSNEQTKGKKSFHSFVFKILNGRIWIDIYGSLYAVEYVSTSECKMRGSELQSGCWMQSFGSIINLLNALEHRKSYRDMHTRRRHSIFYAKSFSTMR